MQLRIGIIVGEPSGDALAAELINNMQQLVAEDNKLKSAVISLQFEGIVGPKALAAGAKQLVPMSALAFMGIVDPLLNLKSLWRIRQFIKSHFLREPPDLFISVDAPDFNLSLAKNFHQAGIPTVHYVSPTIWAWRASRIKLIKSAFDLMLLLYPFELPIYQQHGMPARFVGHPAARRIKNLPAYIPTQNILGYPTKLHEPSITQSSSLEYSTKLHEPSITQTSSEVKSSGFPVHQTITILVGSRVSEVQKLLTIYLNTLVLLANSLLTSELNSSLFCLLPMASAQLLELAENIINLYREQNAAFAALISNKQLVLQLRPNSEFDLSIQQADVVLVTSGTATLEVLLHQKPMLIVYKTQWLTYWLAKLLIKLNYIGMPNILAQKLIAPEFIQSRAQPKLIADAAYALLTQTNLRTQQITAYKRLANSLDADKYSAAQAVFELLGYQVAGNVKQLSSNID